MRALQQPEQRPHALGRLLLHGSETRYFLIAVVLTLLALALRIAASVDDFWLDEIGSWLFARQARTWTEVYTRFQIDNNHLLNTWLLYLFGDRANWTVYRVPAVCAGVGTVLLAGTVTYHRGRMTSLVALLLTACSYPLVLYSSEARGYGPLLFFALASCWCVRRYLARPGWASAGLFALLSVLGSLSHFTFAMMYGALLLWSAAALLLRRTSHLRGLADLARLHVVPAAFFALIYITFIRDMKIGGGPPFTLHAVLTSTLSLLVGGPSCDLDRATLPATLFAMLALAALLVVLYRSCRRDGSEAVLFVAAIAVLPALALVTSPPRVLFERYFLVPLALSLILLADGLAQLLRGGRLAQACGLVLLLGFLGGNMVHLVEQFRFGRGQYARAVAFMATETPQATITVASDHDFRNGMVLSYYARLLARDRQLHYCMSENWPAPGPEWYITHSQGQAAPVPPALRIRGREYRLVHEFPYAGLSGWRWSLYRRAS